MENNFIRIYGKIISGFEFDHTVYGESFFRSKLEVLRLSGNKDIIPILVSERIINPNKDYIGENAEILGIIHSHNIRVSGKERLIVFAFAKEIHMECIQKEDTNEVYLDGYVYSKPVYRSTPNGREVADILIAVRRRYDKTDYIPCICWGRNYTRTGRGGTPRHR